MPSPLLARAQALLAILMQYLGDPTRTADFQRICDEVEALLARCFFEAAARIAGRTDLLASHEAVLVWKGASFQIHVRLKSAALSPLQRAWLSVRRARLHQRIRTALGARSRRSGKPTILRAAAQRRHTPARRPIAHAIFPTNTFSRTAAPP